MKLKLEEFVFNLLNKYKKILLFVIYDIEEVIVMSDCIYLF